MLCIVNDIRLVRATDPSLGNTQTFLERLLLEVTSANYRYFLNELMLKMRTTTVDPQTLCLPPLVANERQVSSLFASALSTVCPVSRAEQAIVRKRKLGKKKSPLDSAGRIDFVASYGERDLGLELKCCPMASIKDAAERQVLRRRWDVVKQQTEQAFDFMKANRRSYSHPVAIGLLAIRVSRLVTSRKDALRVRETEVAGLPAIAEALKKEWKPDFLSYYIPPIEMQFSQGWGRQKSQYRIFPGYIFSAFIPGKVSQIEA